MDIEEDILLTAIIPLTSESERVYNVCQILKECENLPISIIVVFDSQDQVPTQLLDAIRSRSATTLITQGSWKNPGGSRNAGLAKVSSRWVMFWDSDDLPIPVAALQMIQSAEVEAADCCIGGFELENQFGTQTFTPAKSNWVDSTLAYPGLWRFAFRVSIIQDKKFSNYRMGEDQEFLARALSVSKRMFVTKNLVYKYRTGGSTQITKSYNDFSELLNVFDSLYRIERAFSTQATRLTGVMKAKIALTALRKGSLTVRLRMLTKLASRLLDCRTFSSGEVGNGLYISLLLKFKRGRSE